MARLKVFNRSFPGLSRREHRGLINDLVILCIFIVVSFTLAVQFELFEAFFELSRDYEEWELDELFTLTMLLGAGLLLFSVRRIVELKREIRQRQQAEESAHQLARHDALTGLPNRRFLFEDFERRKGLSFGGGKACAVYLIDLDHFKAVNDVHGHGIGDQLLQAMAERLQGAIGADGLVARMGGDEFGILYEFDRGADCALRLARRLTTTLSRPVTVGGLSLELGASIGLAFCPGDGDTLHDLLRKADVAMYRAKEDDKGGFRVFETEMDDLLRERVELERDLREAIRAKQIVPHYQPLVDLSSGSTLGYEVLSRWRHPERGMVMPVTFIPIAEDTGMIAPLTYLILRQACADAKDWPERLFISVNLSPSQFLDPWLVEKLLQILTETGFPPRRLEVEITENALIQDMQKVKTVVGSLRNLGVRVALDDFGTGYSGLYHLRELDLDTVKIDRSFIRRMLSEPQHARIVEAILGLSKSLGLDATAEGIESGEVYDRLKELGCQVGQGYYLGMPVPADDVVRSGHTIDLAKNVA